jgi:internalin A
MFLGRISRRVLSVSVAAWVVLSAGTGAALTPPATLQLCTTAGACQFYEKRTLLQAISGYKGELTAVVSLVAEYTLQDLGAIAKLPQLQRASLVVSPNADLRPLIRLKKLTALRLAYAAQVAALAQVKTLTELVLTRCPIHELTWIKGLKNLHKLQLNESQIKDVAALRSLTRLIWLDLHGSKQLADISGLSQLKQLKTLYLGHAYPLRDLGPLRSLVELEALRIGNTSVSDLSPLAGLKRLRELDLWGCKKVSDLRPLSSLTQLSSLSLHYTAVKDLSPLAGCRGLTNLYYSAREIDRQQIVALKKALPKLNVQ